MAGKKYKAPKASLEEEEVEGITEGFKSGGHHGVRQYILTRLNRWKSTKINIAVTGRAGVGKSSLINALRNMKAKEEGAAKVGSTRTTKEPEPFQFPKNENVVLWDLPGVGTKDFPRQTYKEQMQLETYDAFIIVSADRFTEDDAWFITNAISKHYYMVRTKMDETVRNEKRDYDLTESETLEKVRRSCQENIGEDTPVYLISSPEKHLYDFDKFCAELASTAHRSKHDALLFTLSNLGSDLIMAKEKELESRIDKVAIGSAVAGSVPIPGLETLVDSAILLGEIRFYIEQFEVGEGALINLSAEIGKPMDEIKACLKTPNLDISFIGLAQYFKTKDKSSMYLKIAKYVMPLFGSIISAKKSYLACANCLKSLLDITSEDAKTVVKMRMKHYAKREIL